MRIVLVSDSHGDTATLQEIALRECGADYYLHCGDCAVYPDDILPFAAVRGNVDGCNYPPEKIITVKNKLKILVVHGHEHDVHENRVRLAEYAKKKGCRLVFFGHLHRIVDETIDEVRLLNPGSIRGNRDGSPASYLIVALEDNGVKVEQHRL